MAIKDVFIEELKQESVSTKKMLERVPFDHKDWKPHEKSMSIGRLATHIAELPHWVTDCIQSSEYDFASKPFNPYTASSQEELIGIFHKNMDKALDDLEAVTDEQLNRHWTLRRGDFIIRSAEKRKIIRSMCIDHFIHHRGQLSVYLRLLNVPVPGMYGPSADER